MLLFILAAALAASAPPVELTGCRIEMRMEAMGMPFPASPQIGGLEARFINHAPKVATDVVFRVTAAYRTETIDDRGKFSPGIPIRAGFMNFAGLSYFREEPDACAIVRVTFADGSTWSETP